MQARTLIQWCGWQYGNRLNKDKAEATLAVLGETKRCRSIETAPWFPASIVIGGAALIGENIWTVLKRPSTGFKSIDCKRVVSVWQPWQIALSPSDIQRACSLCSLSFAGLYLWTGRTLSLLLFFIVRTLESMVGRALLKEPFWSRLIRWRPPSTENDDSERAALLLGSGGLEVWSTFLCCDLLVDDGQAISDFGMIIWLISERAFSSEETSLVTVEWTSRANSAGPGLCGASCSDSNHVGTLWALGR